MAASPSGFSSIRRLRPGGRHRALAGPARASGPFWSYDRRPSEERADVKAGKGKPLPKRRGDRAGPRGEAPALKDLAASAGLRRLRTVNLSDRKAHRIVNAHMKNRGLRGDSNLRGLLKAKIVRPLARPWPIQTSLFRPSAEAGQGMNSQVSRTFVGDPRWAGASIGPPAHPLPHYPYQGSPLLQKNRSRSKEAEFSFTSSPRE